MPGPPLAETFTYDGTPGNPVRSNKFNTLDRCMIQTQRFYNSDYTGTHSRVPARVNIPQNSGAGTGITTGGQIQVDSIEHEE